MKYSKSDKAYKKNRKRKNNLRPFPDIFVADFETTTDPENCYVWSACICKLHTKDVEIFANIDRFMKYIFNFERDSRIYFHNLKFDGTFILYYLKTHPQFKCVTTRESQGKRNNDLQDWEYKYMITSNGLWYSITIKLPNDILIEFWDSLKILPMSLDKLTKDFNVEHKKTTMEYTNKKSLLDCSESDIIYIKNDVLGLCECLETYEKMYNLENMTIGSACVADFKKMYYKSDDNKKAPYKRTFLQYEEFEIPENLQEPFRSVNLEQFLRRTYKGAFCYCAPQYQNREINSKIIVLDVNSLYPYVMYSKKYPLGEPHFFEGSPEYEFRNDDDLLHRMKYYFVKINVNQVTLKKGYLPTFQIKNDFRFKSNEWITKIDTSTDVELFFTQTDLELFLEHYNVGKLKFIGGVWFYNSYGYDLFKPYIDKHKKVKENSTGAKRLISKLYLNNLYGKFATNRTTDYKIVELDEDGCLYYETIKNNELKPSYDIAIGSAITAYARAETIRAAQQNYKYFAYADTDSLHLVCDVKDVQGVKIDDRELGKWKLEGQFDKAKYLRQKTYVEINADGVNITACGMNKKCKDIMCDLINNEGLKVFNKNTVIEGGKLAPHLVKGGTVLLDTTFTIR